MALYHPKLRTNIEYSLSTPSIHSLKRRRSESDTVISQTYGRSPFLTVPERQSWPQRRLPIRADTGELTPPRTSRFASSAGIDQDTCASRGAQQFIQLLGKIYCLRDKILQIRSQLSFEQQKLHDRWRLQSQSMREFMETLDQAMKGNTLAASYSKLTPLHQQCTEDLANVETQEVVNRRSSNEVNNLQFNLMRRSDLSTQF